MLKEGLRGVGVPKRPGHTSLGDQGVLPRRWSVLKASPLGVAVPKRPGHASLGGRGVLPKRVVGAQGRPAGGSSSQTAWARQPGGDGESYPGGGRCSRRACKGQ